MTSSNPGIGSRIPRVSVVTAVRDSEAFVSDAVASVLRQTFEDFEFIIVDDGSTDGTPKRLTLFHDPRIRVTTLSQSVGPCEARNIAISESCGEFIAILDSDDICHPQRLETQVRFLDDRPACGAVGSWARVFGAYRTVRRFPLSNNALRASLMLGNPFLHSSVMFRREALPPDSVPYLKSRIYAEDYSLWLRISERWKLANIPKELVEYRTHLGQISERNSGKAGHAFLAARNDFLTRLGLRKLRTQGLSLTTIAYLDRSLSSKGWIKRYVLYWFWVRHIGTQIKNSVLARSHRNRWASSLVRMGRRAKTLRTSSP